MPVWRDTSSIAATFVLVPLLPYPKVHGDERVLLCERARHQAEQLARELDVQQRHPRDAELIREQLRQLQLRDQTARNEDLAEPIARTLLLVE